MTDATLVREVIEALAPSDRERIKATIGAAKTTTIVELARLVEPFAKAALIEYLDLFSGRRVPGRMADVEQNRLLYLAEHAFEGRLPDPDKVADLFQKTSPAAKTLVRNTATRFRHELQATMNEAVWKTLLHSRGDEEVWTVEIRDLALVDHVTELIRRGPGNPRGIRASSSEINIFHIDAETLETLLQAIGKDRAAFDSRSS